MSKESPHFAGIHSALLKALEEGQELLWWAIPTTASFERLRLRQRLLFQFEIGVEINLGGFHGFVPQPQCYYGAIYACVKQAHGCAVTQYMGSNPLALQ
jgi:hypothetical protein